jgi:hypothetical protein
MLDYKEFRIIKLHRAHPQLYGHTTVDVRERIVETLKAGLEGKKAIKGTLINGLNAHQDKPRTIFQLNGDNQRTAEPTRADNLGDRLCLIYAKADRTLLMMAGDGP